ncbi:MAG: ABC transporter permease [Coriobacteriales bacterium]|jgi:ABC-2 type transport system permease protein|nr:ABC transporter permease [Coriobacteriales bacterium]
MSTFGAASKSAQPKASGEQARRAALPARLSLPLRELNAVVAVAARDITITLKSPGTLVMSLVMPLVMMGLIGGNLMENMAGGLGFDFGQFMLVGMLVNMLFMMTTTGLTTLVDDSDDNYSAELLVSPVSRYAIVLGKIVGSSFAAIVSCLGVLLVGLVMGIALSAGQLLALLALAPLMCLSGGALAMIVMGAIKNNRMANIAVMLVTMPQMFLSGVIIPIANSSGVLLVLSRALPMTYCVDLGRAVVYAGSPEYDAVVLFDPAVSLLAIVGLTAVCLVLGTFLYVRSENNR